MLTFDEICRTLSGHSIVREVDRLPKGHVRMQTIFLYPDGASVDVFVRAQGSLLVTDKLSDLGQTIAWLSDVQVKPWTSKKRQALLEDAIRLYDVTLDGGALEASVPDEAQLVDRIVHLGQACVRVADLTYTRRTSLQTAVTEEIEEVIADAELPYDANAELAGKYGAKVRVDFVVQGKHLRSAVLGLSSANTSTAHSTSNEIFRKWHDLADGAPQRVTVFDDRYDTYKDDDLKRLRDYSDVVPLSDRQAVRDLLAA